MCHSPGVEIRSSAGGVVQMGWGAQSIRSLGGMAGAGRGWPLGGRGGRGGRTAVARGDGADGG